MERELFVLLIEALDGLGASRHRPPKARFTDRDIVLVWMWAVLHDRPVDWACRRMNWPFHDRTRRLPSGATMSRRLRTASVQNLVLAVLHALAVGLAAHAMGLVMDGKPLPVSGNSVDRDVGFGRACGVMARGYKLHVIADFAGNIREFEVQPLNVSEQAAARAMLGRLPLLPGCRLLADGNYDSNELYDLAAQRGVQMVAARRYRTARGLGHQRHSPHRLRALQIQRDDPTALAPRRSIESRFGTMGNVIGGLSPLPNAVRGLVRVRRWVTAKLLVDALHRRRRARTHAA
jgi:hypothetical protein